MLKTNLPIPPIELRRSVGRTSIDEYDHPTGSGVLDHRYDAIDYTRVLDFGCGCGRIARQLLQQTEPPEEYLGIGLHKAAIEWCRENLSAPGFDFQHLDFYNARFNPGGNSVPPPFAATIERFTFVLAGSLFTHVIEPDCPHFLGECARVLSRHGIFYSSWFVFEKQPLFRVMQSSQNALYINADDPTNAVYYDKTFIVDLFRSCGLEIIKAILPTVRGHQHGIVARKSPSPKPFSFPEDTAPIGDKRPPISMFEDAI